MGASTCPSLGQREGRQSSKDRSPGTVAMGIALTDIYPELARQVWSQWGKEFRLQAAAKDRVGRYLPHLQG